MLSSLRYNLPSPRILNLRVAFCVACLAGLQPVISAPPAMTGVTLQPGDRIAVVGNTLADRMQHAAWLETFLHFQLPEHRLVVRDLGFSGDCIATRLRSSNFGSPDQWLHKVRADVVVACFGYNESWEGEAGLPEFRRQLIEWLEHLQQQRFNGKSAPRILLCSPTCFEDLELPELPSGEDINARLKLYSAAMQQIAHQQGIGFVDLYRVTEAAISGRDDDTSRIRNMQDRQHARFGTPVHPDRVSRNPDLTINGLHLNDFGNRLVAAAIARTMVSTLQPEDQTRIDLIRTAVIEKNRVWHNIYRATDGYSVFGGRSELRFVGGQTNFDVMQQELVILEAMTTNRDLVIHAAARGELIAPDDSALPKPLEVKTNKPGRLGEGRHRFLGGQEAVRKMTVHEGMQVNLFASEEMFPELVNPGQSAVDPNGRLWVTAWPTYPHWNPGKDMNDKLLILPDDDGDGVADRCITFADGLHNPTGFEFWNGGVLVAVAPDILFLRDVDGDDRADIRERVLHGLDSADTHHTANAFVMSPTGKYHFSRGIFHAENFETPWGPVRRFGTREAGVYEWDPRTFDINFHFPIGPNPHGNVFDQWGNQFATDATSGIGHHVSFPGRGASGELYAKRVRPVPAITILDSQHFPEANRGNLLIANVIGFQGVTQYRFEERGGGFFAAEVEPILYSSDANFRPSDMEIGGDGALYVLDWHNPLIGHMQHNLRDPGRDHQHGRIYRVTAEGRPLQTPLQLADLTTRQVVAALQCSTLSERYRARLELTGRNPTDVMAAVGEARLQLNPSDPDHARHLLELLWTTLRLGRTDYDLLGQLLDSPVADVQAAAVRALRDAARDFSRQRSPDVVVSADLQKSPAVAVPVDEPRSSAVGPLDLEDKLLMLATAPSSQVRTDAVIATAFLRGPQTAEILFRAMQTEQDEQLAWAIREAGEEIDLMQEIQRTLAAGRTLSPAAEAWAVSSAEIDLLLKMKPTEAVLRAVLTRKSVPPEILRQALHGLSEVKQMSETKLLFGLIDDLDERASGNVLNSLVRLLANQPAADLRQLRSRLITLAESARTAEAARVAVAAWINADESAAAVVEAQQQGRIDLSSVLGAVPFVSMPSAQESLAELLVNLIPTLPGNNEAATLISPGLKVEFFAPHHTNVAVETLATLAPKASATTGSISLKQPFQTSGDAFALRFTGDLRIQRSGEYRFFLSSEDGSRMYLDGQLLIDHDEQHELTEKQAVAQLQRGLHALTLTCSGNGVDDGLRLQWAGPGFDRQELPADVFVTRPPKTPQELAIDSLIRLPAGRSEQVRVLLQLLRSQRSVTTALYALTTIPSGDWPRESIPEIGQICINWLSSRPPAERNAIPADAVLALAKSVADRLQGRDQQIFVAALDTVCVPIVSLGTVAERMIYDREKLVAQAGRPLVLRLTNADNMPHNLVVVKPGSLTAVGELAEATGRDPDAAARQFIPESTEIIASGQLLQPGQTGDIFLDVPETEGIYPFVCTYPGHWRRMYGALYVVSDPLEFEENPTAWIAEHKLPIQDELLTLLDRNTDWKLSDLEPQIANLQQRENNFAVGRRIFSSATCASCHRLGSTGNTIGPDLANLPAEYRPLDVLDHILNPTKQIAEKYRSRVLVLDSGKVITGLVTSAADNHLMLLRNPATPNQLLRIERHQIKEMRFSKVSIMPEGILNKLNREEILDLLAFILAAGNETHPLFSAHHHHHE